MATEDRRIDELPAVTELDGNSLMVLQQNAAAMKMTVQQLLTFLNKNVDAGSAVLFVAQNLTETQKAQARTNIGAAATGEGGGGTAEGAVLYTVQTLTEEQKTQARANIGAAAVGEGGGTVEGAVLYTAQELTEEQQAQARKNIGVKETVFVTVTAMYGDAPGAFDVDAVSMTFDEILAAYEAGNQVAVKVHVVEPDSRGEIFSATLPLCAVSDSEVAFSVTQTGDTEMIISCGFTMRKDGTRTLYSAAAYDMTVSDTRYLSPILPQAFTEEQKAQARANIGALADSELEGAVKDALALAKESGEFDGPKGDPFTYEDFTPEQLESLKGKTPVNGEDYNTPAEKQEMVEAVLAELPVWEGGRY